MVLTECGYRCAVPTCRNILALDMHHIWEVKAGGGDDPANLIALCPTCHALYHRGTISSDSIYAYKAMLVAISRAFDLEAIDLLIYLSMIQDNFLFVSGDGVLKCSRLISAGLAEASLERSLNYGLLYSVRISEKGRLLIDAWKQGDRSRLAHVLSDPISLDSTIYDNSDS